MDNTSVRLPDMENWNQNRQFARVLRTQPLTLLFITDKLLDLLARDDEFSKLRHIVDETRTRKMLSNVTAVLGGVLTQVFVGSIDIS